MVSGVVECLLSSVGVLWCLVLRSVVVSGVAECCGVWCCVWCLVLCLLSSVGVLWCLVLRSVTCEQVEPVPGQ